MLKRIDDELPATHMRFSEIQRGERDTGYCFCYGGKQKTTVDGRPYVVLYLRDTAGITIRGYVFNLASPMFSGLELIKVVGNIVLIDWEENYLEGLGLTVRIEKLKMVASPDPKMLSMYTGVIENIEEKHTATQDFIAEVLGVRVSRPAFIKTIALTDYCQGKVGGLVEYYYCIMNALKAYKFLSEQEYCYLVKAYLVYTFVHSHYVRFKEQGKDDIKLVTALTEKIRSLSSSIDAGDGVYEVIHMFFGYEPKDIYVRTVRSIADQIFRTMKEFEVYHTIPLTQEGNAGYGTIKRYQVEKS